MLKNDDSMSERQSIDVPIKRRLRAVDRTLEFADQAIAASHKSAAFSVFLPVVGGCAESWERCATVMASKECAGYSLEDVDCAVDVARIVAWLPPLRPRASPRLSTPRLYINI